VRPEQQTNFEVTATEAMEAAESGGGSARARRKEAENFLRSKLASGPVPQKEIEEEAKANCISDRTLRRAKTELGVKAAKQQGKNGGGWTWELPKYRWPSSRIRSCSAPHDMPQAPPCTNTPTL
jgi:hypothetical protein